MSVGAAIEDLTAAMVGAGLDPPPAPADTSVLDAIAAEIAPLRLPPAVVELWTRLDPDNFLAEFFPALVSPRFALETWRDDAGELPGQMPRYLLLVGYESWSSLAVELDGPGDRAGGAVFDYSLDGDTFRLRFLDVADWLEHNAALIRSGEYVSGTSPRGPWLRVEDPTADSDQWDVPPHPVHGAEASIPRDPEGWPPHWQGAPTPVGHGPVARGATHTIAEVLGSNPDAALEATIAGRVVRMFADDAHVADETGEIGVTCPPETTARGPVIDQAFEFDIAVPPGPRVTPSGPPIPPADPDDPFEVAAAQLATDWTIRATAVARAIRPVDAAPE